MRTLAAARIALRPATAADLPLIAPWYADAAPGSPVTAHAGLLVITRPEDPAAIGIVEYRSDTPAKGWATISAIALAPGQRGWGYGSEAVRALEASLAPGVGRFLTRVPVTNGLGVYFWLRLGYRPAHAVEVTAAEEDTLAMVRLTGA